MKRRILRGGAWDMEKGGELMVQFNVVIRDESSDTRDGTISFTNFPLRVTPEETVGDIKKKIKDHIENSKEYPDITMPVKNQRLRFMGTEQDDATEVRNITGGLLRQDGTGEVKISEDNSTIHAGGEAVVNKAARDILIPEAEITRVQSVGRRRAREAARGGVLAPAVGVEVAPWFRYGIGLVVFVVLVVVLRLYFF
tara:strand:+ start:882 stop:1472 length:591 start_codon:yes stop_codon:yes gene_type:complete